MLSIYFPRCFIYNKLFNYLLFCDDLYRHMKTISSAVEDYIKSKPFLVSALTQGIINLTSLAHMMNKDIV